MGCEQEHMFNSMITRSGAAILLAVLSIAPLAEISAQEPVTKERPKVAVLVYDGVELLDFAGPLEVLKIAAAMTGKSGMQVYSLAASAGELKSFGLGIKTEYDLSDCPDPDILVIPGGSTRSLNANQAFRSWFAERKDGLDICMSVCNGARILAQEGMLDGKQATSHWGSLPRLRADFPEVEFLAKRRFVDSGRVITSAGISAGIDGALHLVARLHGLLVAQGVAMQMEYEWRPEPVEVFGYEFLDPKGDQVAQFERIARMQITQESWQPAERVLQRGIAAAPDTGVFWRLLGYVHFNGEHYEQALQAYARAAEFEEHAGVANYNTALIYLRQEKSPELAINSLEKALQAGFRQAAVLESNADFDPIREHPRFLAVVEAMGGEAGRKD